ncbi:hypothetical protein HDU79_011738 [Rhizoclosmatium sp. JEL0117]|nr:hypothetical protein HDU79_011738 [Rhizoclosmatium sp. JEL0117]
MYPIKISLFSRSKEPISRQNLNFKIRLPNWFKKSLSTSSNKTSSCTVFEEEITHNTACYENYSLLKYRKTCILEIHSGNVNNTCKSVELDIASEPSLDANTNVSNAENSSEIITLNWSSRIPLSPLSEYYCKSSIDVAVENCLSHLDAFTLLLAVRKTMKSSKWDVYFVTTMMQQSLFNGEYITRAVMVLFALVGSGCSQADIAIGIQNAFELLNDAPFDFRFGQVFVIEAIASHRNVRLAHVFLDLLFPVPVPDNEDDGCSVYEEIFEDDDATEVPRRTNASVAANSTANAPPRTDNHVRARIFRNIRMAFERSINGVMASLARVKCAFARFAARFH